MDLSEAFREGNEDFIISHIRESYDIESDPDEILLQSAHYGKVNLLKECLKVGINPNSNSALIWACGKGKVGPIKTLISAGADININDEFGSSPVIASAGRGKLNEVKLLFKHGATLDGALIAAVTGEYIKVVEFLIEVGSDVEELNGNALSSLCIACSNSHKKSAEIAVLLINAGADVNYIRESDGMTPLKFAANRSYPIIAQALIDNGAEVDGPKGTDQTALMLAARANYVQMIETLLKSGADPELQCTLGWAENRTAQGLAELEGCKEAFDCFNTLMRQ